MTKTELALVCAIIDKHTESYTYNYYNAPPAKSIMEVDKLKQDICDMFDALAEGESLDD